MKNGDLIFLKARKVLILIGIVLSILLIPFVVMQFSTEVKWSFLDFAVAALLLFVTGLSVLFATAKLKSKWQRLGAIGLVLIVLLLVWLELAVGIFGTPFAGS